MKNANKPAYPQSNDELVQAFMEVEECAPNGLTKREAFAMAAMQGILSCNQTIAAISAALKEAHGDYDKEEVSEIIARDAVQHADALLKELES